jgi:arylsulfatase A-like enzyme
MIRANLLRAVLFLALAMPLAAADKPNVLFIAVDDLRPELSHVGHGTKTPNVDALARSGVYFNRAYCNQAVCGASRLSLMSGLYPEFTGERTFHVTDWRKRWPNVVTMNQHFKANGYTTVGLGKIYHGTGGKGVDEGNWSEWIYVKGKQYADPASIKAMNDNPANAGRAKKGKGKRGPATESADVDDDVYPDGARAAEGVKRIEQLAKADEPFFLAVGFTKPHLPFVAPKKYWDLYKRSEFGVNKRLRGVPPGYPDYARNVMAGELRSYAGVPPKGSPLDFPAAVENELLHGYYACVSYMDNNVGRLLKALEKSGAAQNTIVVFWGDHGWKLGDHGSWCKHTNYDIDNGVPLIIRYPGMAKGTSMAMVELIDLYPTLVELADLERPKHIQGKSLVPLLKDPSAEHRTSAYSSYPHSRGKGLSNVTGHSIRTNQYRYTEWWEKDTDKVVDAILSDLEADPIEVTAVTDRPEVKTKLSAQLKSRVLDARKER